MIKLRLIGIIIILIIINMVLVNAIPNYFSWKEKEEDGIIKNYMTGVKHQGDTCQSCWAHGVLGVVEAQYNIDTGLPYLNLDLSEQYLVSDCFQGSAPSDCRGGSAVEVLDYMLNSERVPTETCFPYDDYNCVGVLDGPCSSATCTYHTNDTCSDFTCSDVCPDYTASKLYDIKSFKPFSNGDIESIKKHVSEIGPVVTSMNYNYTLYENDIAKCDSPGKETHTIIIAGYNDTGDDTTSYWIIKNSYGGDWPSGTGDGYFKVGFGECSIENYVYGVNSLSIGNIENLVDSKNLTISNTGSDELIVENIKPDVSWVSDISDKSFILPAGSSKQITITVNNNGIDHGEHYGNLIITSDDPDEREKYVPITIVYREPSSVTGGVMIYNFTAPPSTETNYIRIPKNATIIGASLSIREVF